MSAFERLRQVGLCTDLAEEDLEATEGHEALVAVGEMALVVLPVDLPAPDRPAAHA